RPQFRRKSAHVGPVHAYETRRERGEAGKRPQSGGLARAVGAEEGDDLTGRGGQREVQVERGPPYDELGVQAHEIHRSRRPASTATDTASSTTLSTMAACGSVSRAR